MFVVEKQLIDENDLSCWYELEHWGTPRSRFELTKMFIDTSYTKFREVSVIDSSSRVLELFLKSTRDLHWNGQRKMQPSISHCNSIRFSDITASALKSIWMYRIFHNFDGKLCHIPYLVESPDLFLLSQLHSTKSIFVEIEIPKTSS